MVAIIIGGFVVLVASAIALLLISANAARAAAETEHGFYS